MASDAAEASSVTRPKSIFKLLIFIRAPFMRLRPLVSIEELEEDLVINEGYTPVSVVVGVRVEFHSTFATAKCIKEDLEVQNILDAIGIQVAKQDSSFGHRWSTSCGCNGLQILEDTIEECLSIGSEWRVNQPYCFHPGGFGVGPSAGAKRSVCIGRYRRGKGRAVTEIC